MMETTTIAGLPHPVSRVALGTWAIGGWKWGGSDDAQSIATIHAALDSGITLIDTAAVYGFGHSEEIVGEALAGGRRIKAVIATKAGVNWSGGKVFRDSRPVRIREEIENSLRRLRTDYIDLYQVHWPDPTVPFEETAETFEALRREGKILAIGVSNYAPDQMRRFAAAAPLACVQSPLNLFEREIERDVLPYAESSGLTVLAYGPLCRGLLTGSVAADTAYEGDDLRGYDPKFVSPARGRYLTAVAALDEHVRRKHGRSVLALAVRWILDRGPTIALWGARRPAQLAPLEACFGWRLDAADMAEIDAILAATVPEPIPAGFFAPPLRAG